MIMLIYVCSYHDPWGTVAPLLGMSFNPQNTNRFKGKKCFKHNMATKTETFVEYPQVVQIQI